jgi:hypothetical protein
MDKICQAWTDYTAEVTCLDTDIQTAYRQYLGQGIGSADDEFVSAGIKGSCRLHLHCVVAWVARNTPSGATEEASHDTLKGVSTIYQKQASSETCPACRAVPIGIL